MKNPTGGGGVEVETVSVCKRDYLRNPVEQALDQAWDGPAYYDYLFDFTLLTDQSLRGSD
jgi:hypothetical protein